MSEQRTIASKPNCYNERSALTPVINKNSEFTHHLTCKKDAFAYIKELFNTRKVLQEIKNNIQNNNKGPFLEAVSHAASSPPHTHVSME